LHVQNSRTNLRVPGALGVGSEASSSVSEALLVAAHPDDETIGAGATLKYLPGCAVLHMTSGAPRERRFYPEEFAGSRDEYAQLRRAELEEALAFVDVLPSQSRMLGGVEQEVTLELPSLTAALVTMLEASRPSVILTHSYEGGHPDHDATALIVHAAAELLRRKGGLEPLIIEMTSYHAGAGGLVTGEFLGAGGGAIFTFALSTADRCRKERMFACFRSQRRALVPLSATIEVERFRVAPRYDFTRPPHPGPLLYEQLGFPLTGERFRLLAAEALSRLDLDHTACL
jgi:LmbE family N-acetylglucosaminyl deacetylase